MYCEECGCKVRDTAKFCPNCGYKIEPFIQDENPIDIPITKKEPAEPNKADNEELECYEKTYDEEVPEEDYTNDDKAPIDTAGETVNQRYYEKSDKYTVWRALIGHNSDYYISEFQSIVKGEPSFNWMAFFFGGILMIYRKMYGYFAKCFIPLMLFLFAGSFITMIGLSTLEPVYIITGLVLFGIMTLYWLIISINIGSSFNKNYFKRLQSIIKTNNLKSVSEEAIENIEKFGETSVLPVIIIFAVSILILLAIQFVGLKIGFDIISRL